MSEDKRFSQRLYEHYIEDVFEANVLTEKAYKLALGEVESVISSLKKQGEQGLLPMLETPFWKEDLLQFQAVANAYRKFRYVLVIGTGGATLGGRTLCALLQSWVMSDTHYPNLYFLDNLDSEIFWEIISLVNPATTGVLVISKSGETPETLIQLMRCLEYWEEFLTPEQLQKHITVITDPKPSTLKRIATQYGFQQLDHPPQIGGRFSCFTVPSLLPAMVVGVNVKEVRQGAAYLLNQVFNQPESPPAQGAALIWALHQTGRYPFHVLMPYGDAFVPLGSWHRQLWAESLGKDGKGFTPVLSPCPLDQHSQLQLYLAGPKDKFFTFLHERQTARETPRFELWKDFPELNFLAHASISDLVQAEMAATIQVLRQRGCPSRTIVVPTLQEISLGALLMHFMLETLIVGQLLEIDPFSQPAVDAGKVLAKKFLLNQFAAKNAKKKT